MAEVEVGVGWRNGTNLSSILSDGRVEGGGKVGRGQGMIRIGVRGRGRGRGGVGLGRVGAR